MILLHYFDVVGTLHAAKLKSAPAPAPNTATAATTAGFALI